MPQVFFGERALADIERIFEFLIEKDRDAAAQSAERIVEATALLQRHPLVGRAVEAGLRELVISHGKWGYVALYRFVPQKDRVDILAIRHQREAGFR